MEKIYPINIVGVKNIGIEEWLKNYYAPVTGEEYKNIYKNILHAYTSAIKEYEKDIVYWLAISNIKFPALISGYIFDLLRLSRLKEAGFEYVIGQKKEKIADNLLAFPPPARYKLIDSNISHRGFRERMKDSLRFLKHNIPGVINRNVIKNISNPTFLLGKKTQQEVVSYCNAKEIIPIQIFPTSFAGNSPKDFGLSLKNSEMHEFVHDFLSLVVESYPIIRNSTFEVLEKSINECFEYSSLFFHNNVVFFKKFKPKTLLVTAIGSSIHRLFCSAWRYSGGEVVGFVHGNPYCTSYIPHGITDGTLSVLNQYVATSCGLEGILKRAIEDFPLGLKIDTKITHNKQNVYYPLFKELQKCDPVREIKKVMIIGFPMDNDSNMYAWLTERYTFSSLHIELRLVKLLKASGYYVIYKAHPDRISEVEGIFEGYADEVLKNERLEDVYDMADCILFGYSHSTTFGFSLLSKKPIVLIKVKGETWFPRAFELLKKRCCIVDAEADDSGRIIFNDQDVIDAVGASLNNIDYEILHEFAF